MHPSFKNFKENILEESNEIIHPLKYVDQPWKAPAIYR